MCARKSRIAILSFLVLTVTSNALAIPVNVCEWALKKVLIPPTFKDVTQCISDGGWLKVIMPECFLPGCQAMPHCLVTNTVIDVAAHYEDRWEWSCTVKDLDPATEFKKWLLEQVPTLPDVLIPGALTTARAEIQAMRLAAQQVPTAVAQSITALVAPFMSAGTAKFATTDLANVRIISNTNALAKPYLRDGFAAITLHDVVVINDADYRRIMGVTTAYGQPQFAAGLPPDVADPLLLLVHELVHVHQYAQIGFNAFITQYLLEAIVHEYPDISKEAEAYQFELAVAGKIGGTQTSELRAAKATATALGSTLRQLTTIQEGLRFMVIFKQCLAAGRPNCLPDAAKAVRPSIVISQPRPKFQAIFVKLQDGRLLKMPIGGPPAVRPIPMPAQGVTLPIVDPRIRVAPVP